MSKEIHPTQQAYTDGIKYGKELGAIPWRRPEEEPIPYKELILCVDGHLWEGHFDCACNEWSGARGNDFPKGKIQAWVYKNEIPLPEWVKR